tara:strand:- start:8020 stop:8265 length:246 start_codon:yes stop_codon:yes gene_type:complete
MDPNKENKSKKVIADILKNRGFDSHKVISQTGDVLLVAYGYRKYKLSELIKHDYGSKTSESVLIDGEVSFEEFINKLKKDN